MPSVYGGFTGTCGGAGEMSAVGGVAGIGTGTGGNLLVGRAMIFFSSENMERVIRG